MVEQTRLKQRTVETFDLARMTEIALKTLYLPADPATANPGMYRVDGPYFASGEPPRNIRACKVTDVFGNYSMALSRAPDGKWQLDSAVHLGKSVDLELSAEPQMHRVIAQALLTIHVGGSA